MRGDEQYPASSRSVANLREVRLLALLRDVVAEHGKVKAAETLGVSFRTLSRVEDMGRLTPRLADALESHLVQGGGTAAAQQRRQVAELAERVARVEQALVEGLTELVKEHPLAGAGRQAAGGVGGGGERDGGAGCGFERGGRRAAGQFGSGGKARG